MKGKKLLKSILFTLCLILVAVAINTCIKIAVNGMWLWGIPQTDDIASVTISYPDITDV